MTAVAFLYENPQIEMSEGRTIFQNFIPEDQRSSFFKEYPEDTLVEVESPLVIARTWLLEANIKISKSLPDLIKPR